MVNTVFRDNVILLAGASMGIGEQLAYQLAEQGARLVLAARSVDKLERIANECQRKGGHAVFLPTDLTNEAECKRLIDFTLEMYGRLDTLLYNAGRGYPARFNTLPNLDNIRAEITLNYLGLTYCVYYALPSLKQTKGRIVGVGSFGGLIGLPGTAGYNASKHAMRGFLNTLRAELLGTGITVTTLYLGAISTDRLRETMGERIKNVPTMTPERCAQLIIRASEQRRRQMIMTTEGKITALLYQIVPGLMDRVLIRLSSLYD
jgi:short-subunit dehydrogenase